MNTPAAFFAVLGLILAGPAPTALSRARWPQRVPRAALVLWQAIALAAVLSAFGSGLAIASQLLKPGATGRPTRTIGEQIAALGPVSWGACVAVLGLTLLVGARLCYAILRVAVHTRQRRARHRLLVDLLDLRAPEMLPDDVRVLASDAPLAYCLPGLRQRVVVSQGALSRLDSGALRAIVSHERSHLRARHDLVLEAFTAAHHAFPRVVRSKSALDSVKLLIELLADDCAVKSAGRKPLARALVACAGSTVPAGALAVGGPATVLRVRRLSGPFGDVRIAAAAYLGAVAIVIVPTLAVAIPWLLEVGRLLHARALW